MRQPQRVAQACYDAGFRDYALTQAIAIALAESECDPDATYDTRSGDVLANAQRELSCGVFMLNLLAHNLTEEEARNIPAAAMWAYRLFRASGNTFTDWATYSYRVVDGALEWQGVGNGAYVDRLSEAENYAHMIQTQGESLGLRANETGAVEVVSVTQEDESQNAPLPLPLLMPDVLRSVVSYMQGVTSTIAVNADKGTAAQRAACYNFLHAAQEMQRQFRME